MSQSKLSASQKKNYAKTLYLQDELTQKQIAIEADVAEKTISRWVAAEKWDTLRTSITATKAEQLSFLYTILAGLTAAGKIALEDDDPATNPDTDAIAKISKSIERLEKDAGVGEMIKTGIEFLKYVQKEDLDAAKIINKWFYLFIQDKMKSSS